MKWGRVALWWLQSTEAAIHIFSPALLSFLSLVFDQLDVVSYEEVVRLPAFKRKTLVLIGNASPFLCPATRGAPSPELPSTEGDEPFV